MALSFNSLDYLPDNIRNKLENEYSYSLLDQDTINKKLNTVNFKGQIIAPEVEGVYFRDKKGNFNTVYQDKDGDYYYINPDTNTFTGISKGTTLTKVKGTSAISKLANAIQQGVTNVVNTVKSKSSGSGGSGGKSSSYSANNAYYDNMMRDLKNRITALENPKVYTADELAELYGVKDLYDYNRILQMYNDASNKYYTDAIANQEQFNRDAQLSNDIYINDILNNYANSYENAAQTAATRGTVAANLLQTMLGSSQTNEEYASNLNSIVNQYHENWKQELANNPILANDYYNNIGKALLNYGADRNTAEVQNFINHLNAYTTEYAGIRNAQSTLANAAANAYQSNANAALARNASDASWNMWNAYQAYYNQYGRAAGSQEYKDAANAYIYNTNTESQRYTPSTSVK